MFVCIIYNVCLSVLNIFLYYIFYSFVNVTFVLTT